MIPIAIHEIMVRTKVSSTATRSSISLRSFFIIVLLVLFLPRVWSTLFIRDDFCPIGLMCVLGNRIKHIRLPK